MKKYKVTLSNKLGKELLTHNLYAKDRADAESKAKVLLENVRDK